MEHERTGQPLEFIEPLGSGRLPLAPSALLAPMALTEPLLVEAPVVGEGMADRRQQRKQLDRAPVLHRGAGEQPDRPQPRMPGQPQQGLGTGRLDVLGEMGLIHDQHRGGRRQRSRQGRPADQLQIKREGKALLPPVGMEGRWRHHGDTAIRGADHGPGRHQRGEGLAQAHGMGQQSTAASQKPTRRQPLMGEEAAPIGQGLLKGGLGHERAVGRQRRQWLLQPRHPLRQLRIDPKALAEQVTQDQRRLKRKRPTSTPCLPLAAGPYGAQLGLGDGIKGETTSICPHGPRRSRQVAAATLLVPAERLATGERLTAGALQAGRGQF